MFEVRTRNDAAETVRHLCHEVVESLNTATASIEVGHLQFTIDGREDVHLFTSRYVQPLTERL